MSRIIDSCSHSNEMIDERGGSIVCVECGLVIDVYYESGKYVENTVDGIPDSSINYLYELIERLHAPEFVLTYVLRKIKEKKDGKKISDIFVARCLYTTLSDLNIPFSVKDVGAVSGIRPCKLSTEKKNEKNVSSITVIDKNNILERACSKLGLDFKTYTLIKETIDNKNNGFNPSTVISSYIYLFCKKNKIKISLKKISDVTGISCMSIQRFIKKNDLSPRS